MEHTSELSCWGVRKLGNLPTNPGSELVEGFSWSGGGVLFSRSFQLLSAKSELAPIARGSPPAEI